MRNEPFRDRHKRVRVVTSATAVLDECNGMVRQMCLPYVTERRVKGAIGLVARDSGISYSKLRKIYYRLTDHILEFEFRQLKETYRAYVEKQEARLAGELEFLRSLQARERQHDLGLAHATARNGAVEATACVAADKTEAAQFRPPS